MIRISVGWGFRIVIIETVCTLLKLDIHIIDMQVNSAFYTGIHGQFGSIQIHDVT